MRKLLTAILIILLMLNACSSPAPQAGHGQPHAGSSTPGPAGGARRIFWREWRRGDPTFSKLWNSKTPLGNAEPYIVLALLIGFITVVIGCWLSDNCWSPEPEPIVIVA